MNRSTAARPSFASLLVALALAPTLACNGGGTATSATASGTEGSTTDGETTTTSTTSTTTTATSTSTTTTGGVDLPPAEVPQGCNPIAYEADCMLPYPSDWYMVADADLPGGTRIALTPEATPKTMLGAPVNNLIEHPADGFSAHMPILALFPRGIDTANLNFHLDGGDASLSPASPTLLINATTKELVPHWVELDAMADDPARQALIVRPFSRLDDQTRYIVAFQGLVDQSGLDVAPPLGFAHILAGEVAGHPILEPLAKRYEDQIFPVITALGADRDDLQLAWDFTTATEARNTADMMAIRDDVIATLSASGPAIMIDKILDDYSDEIQIRFEGRMQVPLYLEADKPMARLHRDGSGKVVANGMHWVPFTLQAPRSLFPMDDKFKPGRIVQFGHGFFGLPEEINWSAMRSFSNERALVMVATGWVGMMEEDQPAVVQAIGKDPSNVFLFTDRLHQAFANQLALSFAVKTSIPASGEVEVFQQPLYDPDQLYWYGISQGSIFGATFLAMTPTIDKGVLSVGGGPYSLMMTRSGTFADLFEIVKITLGDEPLTIQKFIMMSQHTWDRVDPITYAPYLAGAPLPQGTSPQVLFQYGIGDHSVNNLSSHVLLRSSGIPMLDPGTGQWPWGIPTIAGPTAGSAAVAVDFKLANLPGIYAELPDKPSDEENVHELVRRNAAIRDQIDAFMTPGGPIENFCDGACDPL
ncbi:MAG: hypothetical protein R3B09_12465 [Nannocystaceae bacterium]